MYSIHDIIDTGMVGIFIDKETGRLLETRVDIGGSFQIKCPRVWKGDIRDNWQHYKDALGHLGVYGVWERYFDWEKELDALAKLED